MISCTPNGRCVCACHISRGIRHAHACCCPHRVKNPANCRECTPPTYFPVEIKEDCITAFDMPTRRGQKPYPLDNENAYWLTEAQLEETLRFFSEKKNEDIASIRCFIRYNPYTLEQAKRYVRMVGLQP